MYFDLINALFECFGGVCAWMNVHRLYLDKKVMGIHWMTTLFFTSWGIWNLLYYPSLGQWLSFYGGIVICSANFAWLILLLYYRRMQDVSKE